MTIPTLPTQQASIQTYGALVAFRPGQDSVSHASLNCPDILQIDDIMGRNIRDAFGSTIHHALKNVVTLPSIWGRRECIGRYTPNDTAMDIFAYKSDEHLVVEFERNEGDILPSAYEALKDILLLNDRIRECRSMFDVVAKCVSLLRTISGYDYVAISRKGANGPEIIAEAGPSLSAEMILDRLFECRAVSDVDGPAIDIETATPLDALKFELSTLRYPTQHCVTALKSVGAKASFTKTIRRPEGDWGNIIMLHRVARVPSHRARLAVAHLRPILEWKLATIS